MTVIEFTAIPADIEVRLTRMDWTDAWRRIENQFGQELSVIAKTLFEDKGADLDTLLHETMGRLTHRLNLTLG